MGLAVAAAVSHHFLQNNARADVLRQARLMIEAMQSARDYTTKEIKPLLINQAEHQRTFLPQTVPAFAATENFDQLRATYPDYAYKEAVLSPTNPRDRAVDWEADIINAFRNHPGGLKELVGERIIAEDIADLNGHQFECNATSAMRRPPRRIKAKASLCARPSARFH